MSVTRVSTSALALCLAIAATPAWAQEAPPAPETEGLQEIVVTAQRRSESLQDVPIAISVFSAEAITEQGVGNLASLSRLTPNVTLDGGTPFSGSTAVMSAFVRGIGSDDFAFNIDPGVGIDVDGIYLARTVGANLDLPDVERIEILKGPQGTLFGRNTIGGAISIITREPGRFRVHGRHHRGQLQAACGRGTVDVPLADDLRTSMTVRDPTREGVQRRVPFADEGAASRPISNFLTFNHSRYRSADARVGRESCSMRGKLMWERIGPVAHLASGDYTHSDNTGQANTLLGTSEFPGTFAGTANLSGTAFDPTDHRLSVRRPVQLLYRLDAHPDRRAQCPGAVRRAWHAVPPKPARDIIRERQCRSDPTNDRCRGTAGSSSPISTAAMRPAPASPR